MAGICLVMLLVSLILLIKQGLTETTSAFLTLGLMGVIVIGGMILLGVVAAQPKREGERSQLWRYIMAIIGFCGIFAAFASMIMPGKEPTKLSTVFLIVYMCIPWFIPVIILFFQRKHRARNNKQNSQPNESRMEKGDSSTEESPLR